MSSDPSLRRGPSAGERLLAIIAACDPQGRVGLFLDDEDIQAIAAGADALLAASPPAGDSRLTEEECVSARDSRPSGTAAPEASSQRPSNAEINRLEKVAWDAGVDQVLVWYRDQRDDLLEALKNAVETIHVWHNMGHYAGEADRVWSLYQESPEMKAINAAIAKAEAPNGD